MTIKQLGGIFGRNPSFNDIDVNDITVSGTTTTGDASLNGSVTINEAGADKDFRVESDANTHMIFVDAGNNRLAINKNDPACLVEMFDGTSAGTHEILRLSTWSGSNIKRVKVSIDSNEATAGIIYDADKSGGASPDHIFKQAGSEVGRFKSTGIAFPSGKGIDFSATSGTGTSELFDDYEEGAWTPTIFGSTSGTATLTVAANSYTKVGDIVRVDCLLTSVNVTGLSGSVRLGGFPFSVNGYAPITATYSNLFSFDETTTSVGGFTESGQTYCNLLKGSSKTSIQSTDATATSGSIMFTAVYKATG